MGYLTTFRGLFGNVLEVFHSGKGLQPKDLLHALQNTIEDRKKVLLDGVFVPNHFTVYLSRKDMAEIQPLLRSLIDQLTIKVGEWIAHKGYATLSGTIRVDVKESPELAEDEVYIEAVMQERPMMGGRPEPGHATVSAAAPVPPLGGRAVNGDADGQRETARPDQPRVGSDRKTVVLADRRTVVMDRPVGQLRIVSGKDTGRAFTLKPGDTTIGRGREAQILLQEEPPFVSRLHCTVRAMPGQVEVTDHESTNGVLVSGKRVKQATLRHLDTMQVGSFTLQFIAAEEHAEEHAELQVADR